MTVRRDTASRWAPLEQADDAAGSGAPADAIIGWEDDPGQPASPAEPVRRPVPELSHPRLAIQLPDGTPDVVQEPGTPGFRWWAAAEALARGRDMWARIVPDDLRWQAEIGDVLPVQLDSPKPELNAYYQRDGLSFFHDTVAGVTVYSGESPDVTCHELGHAVLDALRPQLWDAAGTEPAAFHEAFGDVSALLSALELPSLRALVLEETAGKPWRSSRVSRLAEQLGWALGTVSPGDAESNCLRDMSNNWFWQDPATLSPRGPVTVLSTEPHIFGRIFMGAFLKVVAGMFDLRPDGDEGTLHDVAGEAAVLLLDAVQQAPIVPAYFSQVAAHMLDADQRRNGGANVEAIRFAFVRHGVLALSSANATVAETARHAGVAMRRDEAPEHGDLPQTTIDAAGIGLPEGLEVRACGHAKRYGVASAAADVGAAPTVGSDRAAALFVEDLFRIGRVDTGPAGDDRVLSAPMAYKTHVLETGEHGPVLRRRRVDCGMHL